MLVNIRLDNLTCVRLSFLICKIGINFDSVSYESLNPTNLQGSRNGLAHSKSSINIAAVKVNCFLRSAPLVKLD